MSQSPSALKAALALYAQGYRGRPRAGATAPGRVNLIGEHLDYNGGPVLPMAVARRTAVVVGPAKRFEAVSAIDGVVDHFDPAGPMRGAWTDYLAGVIRSLAHRGVLLQGASISVASTIPMGAGLSSSAALTVAAARALAALADRTLPAEVIADVAWEAEHDEVGVRCGKMDQTIAALATTGKALWFHPATGARKQIPFKGGLWVVDTGVRHRLTDGGLNQRRLECEEALKGLQEQGYRIRTLADLTSGPPADRPTGPLAPHLSRRVRHVATETARVAEATDALAKGDLKTLGKLMTSAHASLRDDYEASCEEADVLVEAATKLGVLGARLTGAGWGGSVIVLADPRTGARQIVELQQQFARIYGRVPEAWMTKAGGGVKRETC